MTEASVDSVVSGLARAHGADIYYEAQGSGPTVLAMAGGMSGGITFRRIAPLLAERFRFVGYDRRKTIRSPGRLDADLDMAQQCRDVIAVLDALEVESAVLFGTCGGASIGFELVSRHPERVTAFIAHEPMIASVLDDAGDQLALFDDICRTNETVGPWQAAMKWMTAIGHDSQMTVSAAFRERMAEHGREMIRHELRPMVAYAIDFDAVRRSGVRVVTAVGDGSRSGGYPYARAAVAIAERLGCPTARFPGHHSAYVWRPEEFAAALTDTIEAVLPGD